MSLGISCTTHLFLLAGIVALGLLRTLDAPALHAGAPSAEITYTGPAPGRDGTAGADPVTNILESIPGRIQQAQDLSRSERAAAIKRGAKDLSAVRESSLYEIADLFDVEDRAYAPVDPRPAGRFDIDSQIPYGMKETEGGGYAMVLVDKDGRTLDVTYAPQEVTEDLRAAFKIFKMMDSMPALRKVYMRMAVKFLPQFQKGGN